MQVLIILLIIFNALMAAAIIAAMIIDLKGESADKTSTKATLTATKTVLANTALQLASVLNTKEIKYKGKVFKVADVSCESGNIFVKLEDNLGFSQNINIAEISINEKVITGESSKK